MEVVNRGESLKLAIGWSSGTSWTYSHVDNECDQVEYTSRL